MAFAVRWAGEVAYVASDALLSRHAFSTRHGGVSTLPHTATLNLAFGRGDDDGTVRENLSILGRAVGFDPLSAVSVPQVHGSTVLAVDGCHRGMGYHIPTDMAGDGYVTTDPTVTLGIKTADCTPILLEARRAGRPIAVAALHAGWKGSVGGIVGVGVGMLREAAAALTDGAPLTIHAAIGPCIHGCCFEVREDCLAVVRARLGTMAEPFIRHGGDRFALDLPGLNRALLLRAGVPDANIDVCPDCTACRTDRYYSHRAQQGVRGTMLSVVTLGGV